MEPADEPAPGDAAFVTDGDPAEVAAVVVTYNSLEDIDGLVDSLRHQARDVRLRVIVADNGSTDGTVARVASHPDITMLETGGNLGYSGGINAALTAVPRGEHVFVVNPDLTIDPGSLVALLHRLRQPGVGIAAPLVRDETGELFPSIRREPTLARALGDALLGSRWPARGPRWSDADRDPTHYASARAIDWASGAALLIRADVAAGVGAWDEDYFLYMEEVDYQRRVREAGYEVWFEPAATVRHRQGGSGTSSALLALMAVNRVRYVEKYGSPVRARAFRAIVGLHELLRCREERHRVALAAVLDRRAWADLPRASGPVQPDPVGGAVVIPAHNEASVIGRTLRSLGDVTEDPDIEVIVVSNGSTDDTVAIARSVPGVRAVEMSAASKVAALNEGDRLATRWPRLYLDADIEIRPSAVRAVLSALSEQDGHAPVLEAARPALSYDVEGASWPVRSYYRARRRMATLDRSLWGAGAYAISERGHRRFERFPDVTGDDLFVDQVFPDDAKAVIDTHPVVVRTPRSLGGLLAIQRRGVRVGDELAGPSTTGRTMRDLLTTVRGPVSAFDAVTYGAVAVAGRLQVKAGGRHRRAPRWERDDSSR